MSNKSMDASGKSYLLIKVVRFAAASSQSLNNSLLNKIETQNLSNLKKS